MNAADLKRKRGIPEGYRVSYFEVLDSTNRYLKEIGRAGAPHGTVVIAGKQTAGHGRFGRSFYSPEHTGLYLSLLLRPTEDCIDPGTVTTFAAVAAAEAIDRTSGCHTEIKWVNDIYLGGKKVAGILAEGRYDSESNRIAEIILGIGINVKKVSFPKELSDIATSIEDACGCEVDEAELLKELLLALFPLLSNILPLGYMEEYRRRNLAVGKEVVLCRGEEVREGLVLAIGDDASLRVRFDDGHEEAIVSGEISLKLKKAT